MKRTRPESIGGEEERGDRNEESNSHSATSPKTRERKYGPPVESNDDDEEKESKNKELPNFGLSGALATDEVTGMIVFLLFCSEGIKA